MGEDGGGAKRRLVDSLEEKRLDWSWSHRLRWPPVSRGRRRLSPSICTANVSAVATPRISPIAGPGKQSEKNAAGPSAGQNSRSSALLQSQSPILSPAPYLPYSAADTCIGMHRHLNWEACKIVTLWSSENLLLNKQKNSIFLIFSRALV